MTRLRAVVFDFDGVIVESEAAKEAAFEELFARWPDHRDGMLAYHREHRPLPRRVKVQELARRLGRGDDSDLVEALTADLSVIMLDRVSACPFVPGASELLQELARRVHVAVASITPETDLLELLDRRGLRDFVTAAYGDPPSRKVDAVDATIRAVGGDPDTVVLVGDSPADLEVARSCGVRFIARDSGIPWGPSAPPTHPDLRSVGVELRALLA